MSRAIIASSDALPRTSAVAILRSLTCRAFINYRLVGSTVSRKGSKGRRRRGHRCCVRGLPNAHGHQDKFRPAESHLSHDPVARLHYPDAYNALLASTLFPALLSFSSPPLDSVGYRRAEDRSIRLRMRARVRPFLK